MVASYVFSHDAASPSNEAALVMSSAASASEKAKHRQQAAMLDAWLALHGDNLYPCREEKERLAKDMSMTYMQVNRWFANRRRKQTKRRKADADSPRSLGSTLSLPATTNKAPVNITTVINNSTGNTAIDSEPKLINWPKSPASDTSQVSFGKKERVMVMNGIQAGILNSETDEMNKDTQLGLGLQQSPDTNGSLTSRASTPNDQQRISESCSEKLVSPPTFNPSPLAVSFPGNVNAAIAAAAAAQTANPYLLAAAMGLTTPNNMAPWVNPQNVLVYLQQLQAQASHLALAQHLVAAHQAANLHQQLNTAATTTRPLTPQQIPTCQWLSPPPSVPATRQQPEFPTSPLMSAGDESTSSLSEISELSPRPRAEESTSPIHNEKRQFLLDGDDDLTIDSLRLERKDLSEKESIAVAVLAGMATLQR